MMIDGRLLRMAKGIGKYAVGNVAFQWIGLLASAAAVFAISGFLRGFEDADARLFAVVIAVSAVLRFACARAAAWMGHHASERVKTRLRERIYRKALALGASYTERARSSEIVQVAGEGAEQVEVYFGKYIPQFFYAFIAPITLFFLLKDICLPAAVILLICTPLIPVAVIVVTRAAKKVFSKYWGVYTDLGASFLENLHGLTTLKIYGADAAAHEKMNENAEDFRRATMNTLRMQLSSLTVMDFVAFGGAAAGIIVAVTRYAAGAVDFAGCLAVALLAAEFFIPMRLLGSYFHVAMNGAAACEKIFAFLDLPEEADGETAFETANGALSVRTERLCFSYGEKQALKGLSVSIEAGGLTAIVGESGCGKSTFAKIVSGVLRGYTGDAWMNADAQIRDVSEASLMSNVMLISANSYIFAGSVRGNLLMAKRDASEEEMWDALKKARVADYFETIPDGLDAALSEGGANLSGGQRQRLALARALLRGAALYILDEATSNIDAESEALIMEAVHELAREHTALLISHRLANALSARKIYVMENGGAIEEGTHAELLARRGVYARMYDAQAGLEGARFAVGEGADKEGANG